MPLSASFRAAAFAAFLTLLALTGCERISTPVFSHDIDVLLARGRAFATELGGRPVERLSDDEVIALGYFERARLGLGSPFRLVAYALRDQRLEPVIRTSVAYAILAHTVDGRGYQVHPAVLDRVTLAGVPQEVTVGGYHLLLLEQTIASAPTPRSGELAVRLGYLLAEAERTVGPLPAGTVVHAAALIADRHKAQADAADLLRTAAQRGVDPLRLLEEHRERLAFQVEQPALTPLSPREEIAEARGASRVTLRVRLLAQQLSAPRLHPRGLARRPEPAVESWLRGEVAARLESLAAAQNYPPQAPVAVAVAINREALLSRPDLRQWQRAERAGFADEAWNEERFVAAAARLRTSGAGVGPRLALIELQTAVFLRTFNQEEPWMPGDPAPAAKELEARFGLAEVVFDDDVPDQWRAYYRRMLARSFADLQRVLPTASLRGLTVRIGTPGPETRALALHDPRTRTLVLPPATGSGTLAHEIAHDLDWQLARRRYGRRGGYATDLAVQHHPRDRIATTLSGLAASLLREAGDTLSAPHDTRPAEVFARGTDWFVAAALAREGRMGGYLTSFQDAAITGYGTTRSPDVGGQTVPLLFALLDHIAPVTPDLRQWTLDSYGPARTPSVKEMARTIVGAGAAHRPGERFAAIEQARDLSLQSLDAASCRSSGSPETRRLIGARQFLIATAVGAAARGAAIDAVRAFASELGSEIPRATVDEWLAWRLDGAPGPADPLPEEVSEVMEALLRRAEEAAQVTPALTTGGFSLQHVPAFCGGNPFAAEGNGHANSGIEGMIGRTVPRN